MRRVYRPVLIQFRREETGGTRDAGGRVCGEGRGWHHWTRGMTSQRVTSQGKKNDVTRMCQGWCHGKWCRGGRCGVEERGGCPGCGKLHSRDMQKIISASRWWRHAESMAAEHDPPPLLNIHEIFFILPNYNYNIIINLESSMVQYACDSVTRDDARVIRCRKEGTINCRHRDIFILDIYLCHTYYLYLPYFLYSFLIIPDKDHFRN